MNEVQLTLSPEQSAQKDFIQSKLAKTLGVSKQDITSFRILRKSIDSRGRYPLVLMKFQVFMGDEDNSFAYQSSFDYKNVAGRKEVVIVGAGPAGLFAALRLIELGFCPVILERGKDVRSRKVDVAKISRNEPIDEDSNLCFGEGGAGTFSDGKLYSRSNKRGNIRRILEVFHQHGAQDEILYEAHPHIGTDVLAGVIERMRGTIESCGGKVLFGTKVVDILVKNSEVYGVSLADGSVLKTDCLVLATGHSARDIYKILQNRDIKIEAKGFAMGVRVEHPQELIDKIQYKGYRNEFLPSAAYTLSTQVEGRGVYSFCMCPGGVVVPSATEAEQVVVNGMSSSFRSSPFANSGIVVELHPEDLTEFHSAGELCGLEFQQYLEHLAFVNNGTRKNTAPAQRLNDFVRGELSSELPRSSYAPGVISSPMHFWLPELLRKPLQEGFKAFDRKMRGFITAEAQIIGVESRTSSPIRIPRDSETLQHIQVKGLYPCGEGAGYSGGITSSAIDGERVAEQISKFYLAQ